jgi:ubiquinone/menaquinone biosynthesis C-methylase UbiE
MDQAKQWKGLESLIFTAERQKSAEKVVLEIISLLKVNKDQKILDLCCGVGRHTLCFARLGFQITGVDINQDFLDTIAQIARSEGLNNVELINCDMTKFRNVNKYDLICNLWDSFGFNSIEEDFKCLRNVYDSLKQNGKFVMEISTTEVTAKRFVPRKWNFENGMYILKERIPDKDLRGLILRTITIKGSEILKFERYMYQYTAYELVDSLKKVGFQKIELFENFKEDAYNYNSNNLVLVASK